jgi:hypothetical protein
MGRAAAAAALAIGIVSASAFAQQGGEDQTRTPEPRMQEQNHPRETQEQNHPKENHGRAEQGRAEQAPRAEVEAEVVTASATIQKIDKAGRKLALQDPNGQTFDVKAGPDVDLAELHVGDRVNATYYEEVAVALNKHAEAAPRAVLKAVQRGGVTAKQASVTAKIVAVDTANDAITVRGVDGKRHTLKVADPQLQAQLASIKPGDNVDVTYTQAVAISVEPAAAEPAR